VDLPQRLTRPLRLTPAEGCSLLLGLRALRQSGIAPYDQALQSAEQKLLRALGADAGAAVELADETVVAEPDRHLADNLRALLDASRDRRVVTLEYAAASTGVASRRGLEPYGIVQHNGAWYVIGRCLMRGDVRTFRVDRIVSLVREETRFDAPVGFDLATYRRERLFVPGADAVQVTVRLDPIAVVRVGAGWPSGEVTRFPDGSAEIIMQCEGLEWVIGWTLGYGTHAEIVSPPAAREAMKAKIEAMLS
jgi:predicted DNA-binding transcriptional regulator YafY